MPDETAAKQGFQYWDQANLIKISEEELFFLTHIEDQDAAVKTLWHDNLNALIVTLGKDGCRFYTAEFQGAVPGFHVNTVDTTGAGDGFMAGFLSGLLTNPDAWKSPSQLESVCRRANAVGALLTTQRGAIPALPTWMNSTSFRIANSSQPLNYRWLRPLISKNVKVNPINKFANIPQKESDRTLNRLLPRLETSFAEFIAAKPVQWALFRKRLKDHFGSLFSILLHLYRDQYDFYYHLEHLLQILAKAWIERPEQLKDLDSKRETHPTWFQDQNMLGGVCYADLFAGDLEGIRRSIPYFKELGLTYLHLMPLFRSPAGENDGGYAISSYREVNPKLGTMEQLRSLADDLRRGHQPCA